MKLKVLITRHEAPLYDGTYDVSDAKSFGDACADIWMKLAQRNLAAASSIGAVYEALSDDTLPDLRGVQIRFEEIEP